MVFLLVCPCATPQTNAPADSRWFVHVGTAEVINQPGKLECHPLQYFSDNWKEFNYGGGQLGPYPTNVKDEVRSRRIGGVNSFAIYDVIHEITGGDDVDPAQASLYLPTIMKMILVERTPGEFCEIFNEENFASQDLVSVGPSYLVNVDSETFLATHDQVRGTCGCYNEAYWSFDNDGPILLDERAFEITEKLIGPGASLDKGPQFDIQTLTFGPRHWRSNNGSSSDGYVFLKFAVQDHQLVMMSQTIHADHATETLPNYGAPPERIKIDGAVQAHRLIKQVPPILPASVQQALGNAGGTIVFHAIIGKDGSVLRLDLPLLAAGTKPSFSPLLLGRTPQEIANTVRQWRYEPTMVDGYPVEVETTITVAFPPGG